MRMRKEARTFHRFLSKRAEVVRESCAALPPEAAPARQNDRTGRIMNGMGRIKFERTKYPAAEEILEW
jgi:hypothetical protein